MALVVEVGGVNEASLQIVARLAQAVGVIGEEGAGVDGQGMEPAEEVGDGAHGGGALGRWGHEALIGGLAGEGGGEHPGAAGVAAVAEQSGGGQTVIEPLEADDFVPDLAGEAAGGGLVEEGLAAGFERR